MRTSSPKKRKYKVPQTQNVLPGEFFLAHQYCFFLHDLLVDIIVSGEAADIFRVKFKLKKEQLDSIKGKDGEGLFHWMEENGYKNMAAAFVYKQVYIALLSDFCHFVFEALQNSSKGKLTVTYALLRKPFKENLLYLEWLLVDPSGFLSTFYSGNINKLSLSTSFPREKKIRIIRDAMDKTEMKQWIDPEYIYRLRYDRTAEFSLEHLWQRANHLITTFNFLETEEMNFNFVFSDGKTMESQWSYLYFTLPILLFHARQVIETLIKKFAKMTVPKGDITEMRVTLGFLLCMQDDEMQKRLTKIEQSIQNILKAANLHCPKCGTEISLQRSTLAQIYMFSAIKCDHCKYRMVFGKHKQTRRNKKT